MNSPQKLLIVGDWVVDDNWLTGIHRSSTGLRTGRKHNRSLHSPGSPVQAFCGAGRLASILYNARQQATDTSVLFGITGIGVWRYEKDGTGTISDDAQLLQSMFSFDFRRRQGPYSLRSVALLAAQLPDVELHNMAECLIDQPHHEEEHFATTRVYRVFQRRQGKPVLLARTDWEFPPKYRDSQGAAEWVAPTDRIKFEAFLQQHQISPENVKAVILKDLIKGVVSERLIEVLASSFGDVPWFVSSKRWRPPWLNQLARVNLRLFLIPPIAASTALERSQDLDSWIAPTEPKPTKEAMKSLSEIESDIRRNDHLPLIAVSPREGSILAKQEDGFVVQQRAVPRNAPLVGWATAFFSSLCAHLVQGEKDLAKIAHLSLDFAESWSDSEAAFLEDPLGKVAQPPARLVLEDPTKQIPSLVPPASWGGEWRAWSAATSSNGIIEFPVPSRLELWRGMTALKGYICFESAKRKQLSSLAYWFRDFAGNGIDEHQAVQLVAEPGSGKTYLAECLADASGLRLLPFNITHMNHREDIISCFDTIVTTQASERQAPLLVFFDEFNARIAGHHVYDAFLSPLEESLYVRGGRKFHIKPCVWMFAGTDGEGSKDLPEKYQDFVSRLTLGTVKLGKMSQIEKVYLGVQLVLRRFPDVHRISRGALEQFAGVSGSVRDLRNLVGKLRDVQGGQISKANFPGHVAEPFEAFIDVE